MENLSNDNDDCAKDIDYPCWQHGLASYSVRWIVTKEMRLIADVNSVIITDSLNPIMFIPYLESRMTACEHMQQLHRASTGLEWPGHCDSSIPRLERNRNDGSRALFVFHCKHQER